MATEASSTGYIETTQPSTYRVLWVCALAVSFTLSVFASFRGGYIGPDYYTHFERLTDWSKVFDFSTTSPPIYYLLGHGLFLVIGRNNAFPVTLSIAQAAVNILALYWFFLYSERCFDSRFIHLSLVLFLAFLPVRVIHAATIGTDATTIPLFVLLLFLFDRFLSDESSTKRNAALLGLGLGLAVWTKYSFMALIPAVLLLFVGICAKRRWRFKRLLVICALSLVLPSALALHSFWASSRVHGYNTEKHWLNKGEAPDMDYRDLFSVKVNDIQLFRAPEYFKRKILEPHRHGYLGLLQLGVFTDTMNLFQVPPAGQDIGDVWVPDDKTRPPWKTAVMQASMSLGIVWTFLTLIGVPWRLLCSVRSLFIDNLQREDVVALLGIALFLVIFLPIPFVRWGALFGYWTPRLILPALISFFLAAFLLIDEKIAPNSERRARIVFALVTLQCTIEAVMLI